MNEIIVCTTPRDDWSALYFNGHLICQGSEIRAIDLAECCPIEFITKCYCRWFGDDDFFPEQFADMNSGWLE